MKLKYCGLKTESALNLCATLKIDFVGFILYPPSSRFISFEDLEKLLEKTSKNSYKSPYKTVMVSVNHPIEKLISWAVKLKIDVLQLHGDEDEKYLSAICKNLEKNKTDSIKIFKVLRLKKETKKEEITKMFKTFSDYTHTFLIEPHHKDYGGAGQSLDQNNIYNTLEIANQLDKKIILSGGITKDDIDKIKKLSDQYQSLFAIDVNSSLEREKGLKDLNKMREFYNYFQKTFDSNAPIENDAPIK